MTRGFFEEQSSNTAFLNNRIPERKCKQIANPYAFKNGCVLSGPTARPPYRAIGYGYAYRTYIFQVSHGIALYQPQICPIAAEGGGWKEVSQLKLPSGGYRALRGYR